MLGLVDRFLEFLKRLEAKYYHADYAMLYQEIQSLAGDKKKVRSFSLVNAAEIRSVLVFKPDEIGDCVYSLPALKLLRAALPKAKIYLVCQAKSALLFERTGLVDHIATIDVRMWFRKFPYFSVAATLKKLKHQHFDVGIFLRSYPGYFRQFLRFPCRIQIHPRDPRMRSRSPVQPLVSLWCAERAHQAVQLLQIIEPISRRQVSRAEVDFPKLEFTDLDRAAVKRVLRSDDSPFLVVHPFADFETRHYVYWNEIIRWLTEHYPVRVVVIGGPSDPILPLPSTVIQAQGRLSIAETACLVAKARVFLGNLSGPVHLAGALGVPNISLMSGHSLPSEWTPFGDALVLRADVGCAPCHLRTCHQFRLACVRTLTPAKVIPHLDAFISLRLGIRWQASKADSPTEFLFQ